MPKINSYSILLLCLLLAACKNDKDTKKTEVEDRPPNIVMFLVDDMGWQDTSEPFWDSITPFNKRYHTPNMERLAKEGMKFTQAYAAPICSPTRVSLMTGMNTARSRVTNWISGKNESPDAPDDELEFPTWNMNGISPKPGIEHTVYATTLPQILKNNGYKTIHVGKAHFGAKGTPGADPLNLGFDINIGGHAAGQPGSYLGTENFGNGLPGKAKWAVPGLQKYWGEDIFLSEALTREALHTLDTISDKKPFYLYMSHYAVHTPITGDNRYLQKYLDTGLVEVEAKYASMIEGMDKSLGDIMDYLEEHQLVQNTIILFMSDNGGLSAHTRGGKLNTHNKPLASGKGSMYEGGIREPMIVKWQGITPPGSKTDEYLMIEDFFPSILEMAGIKNPEIVQQLDGQSFIPFLNPDHKKKQDRGLFWHYPNKWGASGPGIGTASAVRKGNWKLIYFYKDQHFELYNIPNDIGEQHDLAQEKATKVKELANVLTDYLKKVDAQLPIDKKSGKPLAYPTEVLPTS